MLGLNGTEDDLGKTLTFVCGNGTLVNATASLKNDSADGVNYGSKYPYSLWLTIVLGLAASIVVILTVFGNILVLLSFNLERSLRKPTNYFIASLAVSDLLIGMFSMPSYTLYLLIGYWPIGEIICDIWLSLDWTLCLVSQYTVLFITTDRFFSLKYPLSYRNWRTDWKVKVVIALLWIVSSLGFFTTIIGWQYFVGERTVASKTCEVQFLSDPLFSFLFTTTYFWTPLIIMITLYVRIYCIALHNRRKQKPVHAVEFSNLKNIATDDIKPLTKGIICGKKENDRYLRHTQTQTYALTPNLPSHSSNAFPAQEDQNSPAFKNRAPKALRTISIILGAYALSWTPYHIMVFIQGICGSWTCINLHLYYFTYWLCYLNSSVNPFCYTFANAKFKLTIFKILKIDIRHI